MELAIIDIEQALVDFIEAAAEVPVYLTVPKPRPKRFVTVERVGGPRKSVNMDCPMVAIQCWGADKMDASSLAREVDGVLPMMVDEPGIFHVGRTGLYNFPDETGNSARYQITVEFTTSN